MIQPESIEELFDPARRYSISQTMLNTFLDCPQKMAFQFMYRLRRSAERSAALEVGTAVHKAFEVILSLPGVPIGERIDPALRAVDQHFEKLLSRTDELLPGGDPVHAHVQAAALVEAWCLCQGDDVEAWEPAAAELTVAPTLDSPTGTWMDRAVGKIDGLVYTEGHLWLLEHKTKSQAAIRNFEPLSLTLDNQTLWYLMLYQMLSVRGIVQLGTPRGFQYNVLAKPMHKLTATGAADLQRRMVKAMLETPAKYFSTHPVEVTDEWLQIAKTRFGRIVAAIDALDQPGSVTMNTRQCDAYGGCPYRPLCLNGADANDPDTVWNNAAIDQYTTGDPFRELASDNADADEEVE